jgi:hypothetical protein
MPGSRVGAPEAAAWALDGDEDATAAEQTRLMRQRRFVFKKIFFLQSMDTRLHKSFPHQLQPSPDQFLHSSRDNQ